MPDKLLADGDVLIAVGSQTLYRRPIYQLSAHYDSDGRRTTNIRRRGYSAKCLGHGYSLVRAQHRLSYGFDRSGYEHRQHRSLDGYFGRDSKQYVQ